MPGPGGQGPGRVVITTTGMDERAQNELYLLAQSMGGQLMRDKVTMGVYGTMTTHLVVGRTPSRTDKLLCALAAGVPIVTAAYLSDSHKAREWLKNIEKYDVGREQEWETEGSHRLFVPTLQVRQRVQRAGGVFRGWRVVVLLDNERQKEVYRRLLELGGAAVLRWTVTHLQDLPPAARELATVTHIVAPPALLLQADFRQFMDSNDTGTRIPVVTQTYIGDFLTKRKAPAVSLYDLRNPELWALTEEPRLVEELRRAGLGRAPGPPSLQEEEELVSPGYSDGEGEPASPAGPPGKRPRRSCSSSGMQIVGVLTDEEDSNAEVEIIGESVSSPVPAVRPSGLARLKVTAQQLLALFSHNFQVVRRRAALGLEVGGPPPGPRDLHGIGSTVTGPPVPVTAAMCQRM